MCTEGTVIMLFEMLCRYDCIENDLLGPLQLGTHNIAPYRSKGIERALELSACWSNKANRSDKELLDYGTSGIVDRDLFLFIFFSLLVLPSLLLSTLYSILEPILSNF